MADRLLTAVLEPFGLNIERRAILISAKKLRAFTGQLDPIMIKPAAIQSALC